MRTRKLSGNRSIYKSGRESVDSKGLYERWRLHLMKTNNAKYRNLKQKFGFIANEFIKVELPP